MEAFVGQGGKRWEYDPQQPLGNPGGSGAVFAGRDEAGTPVAVKVMSSKAMAVHPRLLQREIEIAVKLRGAACQRVVRTLDVADVGGRLALVMERAEGTLSAVREQLNEEQAIGALRDIAAALSELHQLGIIHRDLKPSNVLWHDGVWKLADFGIAHDSGAGMQTYTFAGRVGTWAYAAPELFEPRSPTVKSDLYALGCVAFQLIAGRVPFAGPDYEDFRRQHHELMPPELPLGTNPALKRLIVRLLSKQPEERPQDARDVSEALRRLVMPLSAAQQALLQASSHFATTQSEEAAREAARLGLEQRQQSIHKQVLAELRALCADGLDAIHSAGLSDVAFSEHADVWVTRFVLEGRDARLVIEETGPALLRLGDRVRPSDPLISVMEINARNRQSRHWAHRAERPQKDYPVRLASVVAEIDEGRVSFWMYRFSCSDPSREYRFGPKDREHGVKFKHFVDRLDAVRRGSFPGATMKKAPLTSEALVELYAEALTLPPDAYAETEWVGI